MCRKRDITGSDPSFVLYTAPLTTEILFVSQGQFCELFTKKPKYQRFYNFQESIENAEYTTVDRS